VETQITLQRSRLNNRFIREPPEKSYAFDHILERYVKGIEIVFRRDSEEEKQSSARSIRTTQSHSFPLTGASFVKQADTPSLFIDPNANSNSGPRRISTNSEDRAWFGEYYANSVGMFDPKTEQFKEWKAPAPWVGPYPAK
jgi:hypothetical protein